VDIVSPFEQLNHTCFIILIGEKPEVHGDKVSPKRTGKLVDTAMKIFSLD
jgi:hypothetical protein